MGEACYCLDCFQMAGGHCFDLSCSLNPLQAERGSFVFVFVLSEKEQRHHTAQHCLKLKSPCLMTCSSVHFVVAVVTL